MKKLLILTAIFIIAAKPFILPQCNLTTINQAIEVQIFAQQTIDGRNQPVLITRFLHNKAGIYASETAKCYFSVLDLSFLSKNLSLIGLVSFLYLSFLLAKKGNMFYTLMFLLIPILPIFKIPETVVIYTYKGLTSIGVILFALKN